MKWLFAAALARIKLDASAVQEVIFGNVLSANLGQVILYPHILYSWSVILLCFQVGLQLPVIDISKILTKPWLCEHRAGLHHTMHCRILKYRINRRGDGLGANFSVSEVLELAFTIRLQQGKQHWGLVYHTQSAAQQSTKYAARVSRQLLGLPYKYKQVVKPPSNQNCKYQHFQFHIQVLFGKSIGTM